MKKSVGDIEYKNIHFEDGVQLQSVDSSTFIFTSSFTRRGITSPLASKIRLSDTCRCGCCPGCRFSPTTEGIVFVAMSSFYSLPWFPPLNALVEMYSERGRVFLSLYFLETIQKIYEARDRLSSPKEGLPHPFPLPQSFKGTDRGEGHHETGRS